ncbi:CHAT domain-containing protein [Mycena alexandri]|uniref:CHAT domain-containing protein n=1 Tax=Mycena alexandri TaxID=1745969 RepID=A0AAD6T4B1_9AGAR|nr:CHAT domain-containing protein [Mycena alexandri]
MTTTTNAEDLVAQHLQRLALCPPGHPERPINLIIAATQLFTSYVGTGNSMALSEATRYSRETVSFRTLSLPFQAAAGNLYGNCLVQRFKLQGQIPDLDAGILCHRRVLALRSEGHDPGLTLNALAEAFILRFEKLRRMEDLVMAIVYSRGGLTCPPPILEVALTAHDNVARSSYLRFELLGQGHDIADAVEITRRALDLTRPGDDHRPLVLQKYIFYLEFHYQHFGQSKHLDDAESRCREFIRLCPSGHLHHALASRTLGSHLLTRFQTHNNPDFLEEAISLCENSLRLQPPGDINRDAPLKSLAVATRLRFEMRREEADLQRSIEYGEEALDLCRSGSTPYDSAGPLHALGMAYLLRFEHRGEVDDLEKALQRCLDAVPLLGSSAFLTLGNMVTIYRYRYYRLQDPNDLREAEKCGLQALQKSPQGDPGKFITFANLAGVMADLFEYFGKMEYLEDAISHGRRSLSLCPPSHPEENLPTINLALMLSARLELLGEENDMMESDRLSTRALSLCPSGHPKRERCLRTLMVCSKRFWTQTRDIMHLDRAIQYARDALPLYSTGSIDHSKSQEYLGVVLRDRFLQSRQRSDLEESIELQQAALALCPDSSYDHGMFQANLGTALSELFEISDDRADLEAAIAHYSRANQMVSTTHPLRSNLESGLALAYLKIIPTSETLVAVAFSLLEKASNNPSASSRTQLDAALRWTLAARAHKHPSMISAFSRLLTLLELRLLTKETVEAQQEFLRGIPFRLLASEAAASAIEEGRLDTAVELLEQGRTMLWSRMRGYRHPINDLRAVNTSLADQFQTASAELEHTALALQQRFSIFSSTSVNRPPLVSDIPIDNRLRNHRILSENWTRILNEIREVDGFAEFLRTPSFSTLRVVASEGPVILVNVAQGRCDAMIIHHDSSPHLVPLPESTITLFDHLATQLWDSSSSEHNHRAKRLTVVLRELWRAVVHPVVEVLLSLKVELTSRIWWCPTAQLCALPLHAAGPYTPGQRNLPDLFVSSYTPTLNALMTARAGVLSTPVPRLLIIGQPQTLPMVETEIEAIRTMSNLADVLLGAQANADTVLSELRTHSWIHFACHGSRRHAEPFKSAFELYDGSQVTVLDIARANLPCAEFAFLSACHTAAPDIGTPDEFITLAAALQFAGFGGVVSTFWAMADEDGPQTSRDFYSHMFRRSTADSRDAAVALNLAVRSMRKRNIPVYRWVNFIHIGI